MLNTIQQDKAITYLRYALADLEGLLDNPMDGDTQGAACDTVHAIRTFLKRLELGATPC